MKFKGAGGGVANCRPAVKLAADRDSREGEDNAAADRSAKDAGRLEDAHQKLIDDLVANSRISGPETML